MHKVKPEDLKWDEVEKGANELLKAVESAHYTPPEEAARPLRRATAAMNKGGADGPFWSASCEPIVDQMMRAAEREEQNRGPEEP